MAETAGRIEVGVNRIAAQILGRAIFGTSSGLTISGNGLLAAKTNTSGVFDFDVGRGRDRALHQLQANGECLFRRRVVDRQEETPLELLGLLAPCKDRHGRPGFVGACVAIERDNLQSRVSIHDWSEPFQTAEELFKAAKEYIDPSTGYLHLPRKGILEPTHEDQPAELHLMSNAHEILFNDGIQPEDAISRVQALAFVKGEQLPTILLFTQKVPRAEPVSGEQCTSAVQRLEHSVERREREFERQAEVAQHKPRERIGAQDTEALVRQTNVSQDAGEAEGWSIDYRHEPVLMRITALERDVKFMRSEIIDLRQHLEEMKSTRHAGRSAFGREEVFRREEEEYPRFGVSWRWIAAATLMVICIVSALLWLFSGARDEVLDDASSTDIFERPIDNVEDQTTE